MAHAAIHDAEAAGQLQAPQPRAALQVVQMRQIVVGYSVAQSQALQVGKGRRQRPERCLKVTLDLRRSIDDGHQTSTFAEKLSQRPAYC